MSEFTIMVRGKQKKCCFGSGKGQSMNRKIFVKETNKGKGLFAKEKIKKGEVIWFEAMDSIMEFTFKKEDIEAFDDPLKTDIKMYSYQVGDNLFASYMDIHHFDTSKIEQDNTAFLNHSCKPNVWWDADNVHVAMRDIQAGEELTLDYATIYSVTGFKTFKCLCNSGQCRGQFRGDEYLMKETQERYKGHFVSYLERKIERLHMEEEEKKRKQTTTTTTVSPPTSPMTTTTNTNTNTNMTKQLAVISETPTTTTKQYSTAKQCHTCIEPTHQREKGLVVSATTFG